MTMLIGLLSGKEFVVQDKFYSFFANDGSSTRIFRSLDDKRLITIPPEGSVEFFDEPSSKESIEELEKALLNMSNVKQVTEKDPNVG